MSTFITDDVPADAPVRRYSEIARVDLVVRVAGGKLRASAFNSSFALFRRLDDIGGAGETIVYFARAGKSLTPRSLGALNAFLRLGKGLKYWRRLDGGTHRWGWHGFMAHLGLKFN